MASRMRLEPWLAGSVALACLVANAVTFFAPWLESDMSGRQLTLDRDALADGIAYERHLVQWTAIALPVAAFALAGAAMLARPRALRWYDQARVSVWLVAATAGAVAVLVGARLGGFEIARVLDPGQTTTHLRASAYAIIAAGSATLGLAAPRVWSLVRPRPDAAATICAATLVAAPLIPFGTVPGDFPFHYDELTLALIGEVASGPIDGAVSDLALARTLLGATALAGVGLALATVWTPLRLKARMAWLAAGLLPAVTVAAFFAVRFQVRWADLDAVRPGWNYLMPIGVLAASTWLAITTIRRIRRRHPRHPA